MDYHRRIGRAKPNRGVSSRSVKRTFRVTLLVLAVIALAALALSPISRVRATANSQSQNRLSKEALRQIQALLLEKESRTPAQQKLDSQLVYAIKMQRSESIATGVQTLAVDVGADDLGTVVVDVTAIVDEELLKDLKDMGVEVFNVFPQYHSLRAVASLDQLETIANLTQVHFIQPKQGATTNQTTGTADDRGTTAPGVFPGQQKRARLIASALSQTGIEPNPLPNLLPNGYTGIGAGNSEGVITHKAYSARGTFNVNGTGIRIGVLTDGVTNLAAGQASGDIPPTCSSPTPPATEKCVQILPGQTGSGDEGTAILEIIHDMTPGAQLYFATAFGGIASFAQNIRDLRTAGCDVIVDDVSYFVESPFQDGQTAAVISTNNSGVVTQAVNDVVANGALYFSSAANSGNKDDGTAGTWEGDFNNGGALAIVPGGNVHDFGGAVLFDAITLTASGPINLHWSDPLGGSTNDYDLYVLNSTGTAVVASSTNVQSGTQDPYEQVGSSANVVNNRVVILQKTGAANRFLHLGTNRGRLNTGTAGETHGHNAASGAYGVAATPAYAPFTFPPPAVFGPFPNLFSGSDSVQAFSSDGPRRIFFNADGTAITPGNLSSTGGSVLQQPLITAADGVQISGAGGFSNPFFGTSAAAPHAAAIAGLLKATNPNFTPAQIKTALTTTAIDIETIGTDRDSGFGTVMPYAALQILGVTGKAYLEPSNITETETCCNANGLIEPGEAASLSVTLNNTGLLAASGITATLTTSTPSVTIFNGASAYPNLPASGGSGSNSTPFTFKLAGNPPEVDRLVDFTLTIGYTGGWNPQQVINFLVQTGRRPITTILDTTAPATSTSFPGTSTNTQTNRLFRSATISSCAASKAFPGTSGATNPRFDSYTLTNPSASALCVTVTLTPDKSSTGFIQGAAYTGSYDPLTVSTNYLADIGASPTPGYPKSFSFSAPAGGTFVVVVNEVAGGVGISTPYTLQVSGLPAAATPTAAPATISGAVTTPDGSPLSGVTVRLTGPRSATTITNSSGTYRFDGVDTDNFYTVTPERANYRFNPASRSFSLLANKTDALFTGTPEAIVTTSPIDSAEFFVRQQYVDFLGREPDQGGFDYWTAQINQCSGDTDCIRARRLDVSAAFFAGPEFQQTGLFVYLLYKATLGRQLSYAEFSADHPKVVAGPDLDANKTAFAEDFVQRVEFIRKYDADTTAESFVDALIETYQQSGGADLAAQRSRLIGKYNAGANLNQSRSLVVRDLADSVVLANAVYNQAFVLMEYFGYLRRDPDHAGYDFWLNVVNNSDPNNYRGMVCTFINSVEYQQRFGPVMTHSNAECYGVR